MLVEIFFNSGRLEDRGGGGKIMFKCFMWTMVVSMGVEDGCNYLRIVPNSFGFYDTKTADSPFFQRVTY
jgi:hypothetical protein